MNYLPFFENHVEGLKKSGKQYLGYCPFHGDVGSKKKGFSLDPGTGRYRCHSCGAKGNAFSFFKALGLPIPIDLKLQAGPPTLDSIRNKRRKLTARWQPETLNPPCEIWQKKALSLFKRARNTLQTSKDAEAARQWLARDRGIQGKALERLGYVMRDLWFSKAEWGLEDDGKKIWFPAGLTIPVIQDGSFMRVQVRRPIEGDHKIVSGSQSKTPMRLNEDQPFQMVVESDLDALLLWEIGEGLPVGFISMRTAQNRPDTKTNDILRNARKIFVSLDSDKAGRDESRWWLRQFKNAVPWPIPSVWGKDPGDAYKAGYGDQLRSWIEAALASVGHKFQGAKKEEHNSLTFHSKALDRNVNLNWQGDDPKVIYVDQVPFTADEIETLKRMNPTGGDLRAVCRVKESFQGEIKNQ